MSKGKYTESHPDVVLIFAQVQKPAKDYETGEPSKYRTLFVTQTVEQEQELLSIGLTPRTYKHNNTKTKLSHDAALAELGLTGRTLFTAERSLTEKDGTPKSPVVVTDAKGTPIKSLLGNGTKARLHGVINTYTNKFGPQGVFLMDTVQVTELVVPTARELPASNITPLDGFVATDSDVKSVF